MLSLILYVSILTFPDIAMAERVYTESTMDVIAVDEQTVTMYGQSATPMAKSSLLHRILLFTLLLLYMMRVLYPQLI